MPVLNTRRPQYTPQRVLEISYNGFPGGLNLFFTPTEIKATELSQADNTMLVGAGVVTGRWGSQTYFSAGSGYIRDLNVYQNIQNATNELLAVTDRGFLVKKSGTSNTIITGASFASGAIISSAQLGNNMYYASDSTNFTKYDGTNLSVYTGISRPSLSGGISLISGATGTATWSYRVTAFSQTGETLGSPAVSRTLLSFNRDQMLINIAWSQPSTATTLLKGFGIYAGLPGEETLIANVGPDQRSFIDNGYTLSTIASPTTDTTAGVKAKYIKRFDDRLILAGIANDPTMVMISGKYPYQDRFNWQSGGGYVKVAPDSGDEITGIEVVGSNSVGASLAPSILVFMKNSVHQIVLNYVTIGEYSVLNPIVQTISPVGASNQKGIVNIQNNTFYIGRLGLQTVGQEAAYLNQIRTSEVSARIRPYFDGLTEAELETVASGYMDYKYLFSFPTRRQTYIYDYERGAFMGPWLTPFGISSWLEYINGSGEVVYLAGCTDGLVRDFSTNYHSDSGTAIIKTVKTKKEDFGNWSVLKVMRLLYALFRNVDGTVNLNIILENRAGGTEIVSKSFSVSSETGGTGWGTDLWGSAKWGTSGGNVTAGASLDIIRWLNLYKTARTIQIEISQIATETQFEIADIQISATLQPEGSLSSSLRI